MKNKKPKYELFDPDALPKTRGSFVTILKGGTFRISEEAVKQIGKPPYVQILWDGDRKTAALKPHTDPKTSSYFVRYQKNFGGALIGAAAFLRHIQFDYSRLKTQRCAATWNKRTKLLEFQIIASENSLNRKKGNS